MPCNCAMLSCHRQNRSTLGQPGRLERVPGFAPTIVRRSACCGAPIRWLIKVSRRRRPSVQRVGHLVDPGADGLSQRRTRCGGCPSSLLSRHWPVSRPVVRSAEVNLAARRARLVAVGPAQTNDATNTANEKTFAAADPLKLAYYVDHFADTGGRPTRCSCSTQPPGPHCDSSAGAAARAPLPRPAPRS